MTAICRGRPPEGVRSNAPACRSGVEYFPCLQLGNSLAALPRSAMRGRLPLPKTSGAGTLPARCDRPDTFGGPANLILAIRT